MSTINDPLDPLDPLDALKSELASVSVSPDFASRVLAQIEASPIDVLKDELAAVSVSPEFAVRVRQQIEDAAARPRWFAFLDWRWAAPVAAAAVIGAIAISRGGAPTTPTVTPSRMQASAHQTPSQRSPEAPQTASLAPQPALAPQPTPSGTTMRATQRTATTTAASVLQTDDKLEVITYQPALYRQLWAAAAGAQVVDVAELPVEVREIAITPLEVGPVVVKWFVEPPVPSGGAVPEIRRVSAVAERSDK